MKTTEKPKQTYGCKVCENKKCELRGSGLVPPSCQLFMPPAEIATADELRATSNVIGTVIESPERPAKPVVHGVWSSDYVCKMGIKEHCDIVLESCDKIRAAKFEGDGRRATFEAYLNNELMDLHIILSTWAARHPELLDQRLSKFRAKATAEMHGTPSSRSQIVVQ